MKYIVLYKRYPNGRAPSCVAMEDYEEAGVVEAPSRQQVVAALFQKATDSLDFIVQPRPIVVGDIIVEHNKEAFIYTPSGIWASVELVNEPLIDT